MQKCHYENRLIKPRPVQLKTEPFAALVLVDLAELVSHPTPQLAHIGIMNY